MSQTLIVQRSNSWRTVLVIDALPRDWSEKVVLVPVSGRTIQLIRLEQPWDPQENTGVGTLAFCIQCIPPSPLSLLTRVQCTLQTISRWLPDVCRLREKNPAYAYTVGGGSYASVLRGSWRPVERPEEEVEAVNNGL